MAMDYPLNEITSDDDFLKALPLLHQLAIEENNPFVVIPSAESSLSAWKKAIDYGYKLYAVWDESGLVLAVFGLTTIYDPVDARPSFRVNNLIVEAAMRGKGIGRMIMEKIEQLVRQQDGQYIMLEVLPDNHKATDFYTKSLGYAYACNRLIKTLD